MAGIDGRGGIEPGRLPSVDIAKGIGILGVVTLHAAASRGLDLVTPLGWAAGMGVAILLTCMGVVTGLRIQRLTESVEPSRYLQHVRRRAARLLPAFLIAWVFALGIGLVYGGLVWGPATLVGMLPTPGMGAYFVPLVVQWVLFEPFAALVYSRRPVVSLAVAVILQSLWWAFMAKYNAALHIWVWGCLLAQIGLMMAGVAVGSHLRTLRWRAGAAVVLGCVAAGTGTLAAVGQSVALHEVTRSVSALALTCCILAAASSRPNFRGVLLRAFAYAGRASWHIFLVNLLYFSTATHRESGIAGFVMDVAFCIALGLAWFRVEESVRQRRRPPSQATQSSGS